MILDQAEYKFVHSVSVNCLVEMTVFQAEVEGIRLEYYKGTFSLDGESIAVYGRSYIACQVTVGGILRALAKAVRKEENPELLVTG